MTTIGRLDSFFTSLINDLMILDRQPLNRLQEQRDSLNVRRGAYLDTKSQLEELQDLIQSLRSTDPFSVVKSGRSVAISNRTNDASVLSASASSSAVPGTYEIVVGQLAKAQSRASAVQASTDLALGKSGTFWLGGSGSASAQATANGTITGVGAGEVAANQRELGTGQYTVETRDNDGVLEFRLKDVDGMVVSIRNRVKDDGSFTTGWQTLAAGEYDTGRGLSISFSGAAADASTVIDYTAAGTSVTIQAGDSLIDIANAINEAVQPDGRDLKATLVGKQLVLTAVHTGTAHTMIYTDGAGLGFNADLQAAQDASFTVNNLQFTRSSNNSLTDVIHGLTLNLAADAEGNCATLTVRKDMSGMRSAIESFVSTFNKVQTYLESKTAITSVGAGESLTYVRGTLSGDNIFSELRTDLFSRFTAIRPNAGMYSSLREIGLTIDSSLQASIDSQKLEAALEGNLEGVSALLDEAMGSLDTLLARFTGDSSGYLDRALDMFDSQVTELDGDILDEKSRLDEKELVLAEQFAGMQAQLMILSYTQQMWSSIYGNFNSLG